MSRDLPDSFDFDLLDEIPDPLEAASSGERRAEPTPRELAAFEQPSATRAAVRGRRLAAVFAAVAWLLGHFLVVTIRGDIGKIPAWYLGLNVLLPVVSGVTAAILAIRGGKTGLGGSVKWAAAAAITAAALFWLVALGLPVPHADGPQVPFWEGCFRCFDRTLIWALVPVGLAALGLRSSFATAARWRSAAIGGACGVIAGGLMNLICANSEHAHVAVSHGLPALLTTLGGAYLIARSARI